MRKDLSKELAALFSIKWKEQNAVRRVEEIGDKGEVGRAFIHLSFIQLINSFT